mmetsp:Transcript_2062/g.7415  ORF Transcript_2062/g.7415 Transcript_2062/m.7415 type:complete len:117 (+) Transcript_2062:2663-3013(+)
MVVSSLREAYEQVHKLFIHSCHHNTTQHTIIIISPMNQQQQQQQQQGPDQMTAVILEAEMMTDIQRSIIQECSEICQFKASLSSEVSQKETQCLENCATKYFNVIKTVGEVFQQKQ